MPKCSAVGAGFCKGFRGVVRGTRLNYGVKKITQITENQEESPKSRLFSCFLGYSHVGVKPKQKMTNCS